MSTITLSVPSGLKTEMDLFEDINWSAVAREAIKKRIEQLKLFKSIVSKSKLTEKDAIELGKKINKAMHEQSKKEHPEAY